MVTEPGTKADPRTDRIEVDGARLRPGGPRLYIMLNKPRGVISAVSDPAGRPVVTDLVRQGSRTRLFPVGRLDYDAEGLIILTNDGGLANLLMHPRYGVPKKYLVKVRDVPDGADIRRLERGVVLEDGRTLPARVRLAARTDENSWLEITVTEGRNRLVKRMCAAVGHPVSKLRRVEYGPLKLGALAPGRSRPLTTREVERLRAAVSGKAPAALRPGGAQGAEGPAAGGGAAGRVRRRRGSRPTRKDRSGPGTGRKKRAR